MLDKIRQLRDLSPEKPFVIERGADAAVLRGYVLNISDRFVTMAVLDDFGRFDGYTFSKTADVDNILLDVPFLRGHLDAKLTTELPKWNEFEDLLEHLVKYKMPITLEFDNNEEYDGIIVGYGRGWIEQRVYSRVGEYRFTWVKKVDNLSLLSFGSPSMDRLAENIALINK